MFLRHLPRDSSTVLEIEPDAVWGLPEQLQAVTADLLAEGNWQRAGDKHAKRPKPIERPGVTSSDRRYGRTGRSREEVRRILRPDTSTPDEGVTNGD